MQDHKNADTIGFKRVPWNKGKLIVAKPPLRPKHLSPKWAAPPWASGPVSHPNCAPKILSDQRSTRFAAAMALTALVMPLKDLSRRPT
jgi:hypothetical protein